LPEQGSLPVPADFTSNLAHLRLGDSAPCPRRQPQKIFLKIRCQVQQVHALLRLLTNAIYVGQVEHKGQLYTGEQAAIIEPSMWEPIQDELRARHTGARGTVHNNQNALLNGLLFCHLCDRPMAHTYTAAHGRRYRYYVCRRAHQRGRVGCPTRAISARAIEDSVVQQLRLRLGK